MISAIESELGSALAAVLGAAYPTAAVRTFIVDDASGSVDEEVDYPCIVIEVGAAVPLEAGDILHFAPVRVMCGTNYTQDRKGTTLAALWLAVRDVLYGSTAIDEEMAGNVVLKGLFPTDEREPYKTIQPGSVDGFPNLQGYELNLTAAIAACDITTTTTTTTTTTAP